MYESRWVTPFIHLYDRPLKGPRSGPVHHIGIETVDKIRYQWLMDLTLLEEWALPFGKIGVGAKQ